MRRAESRRISSMSSAGRGFCVASRGLGSRLSRFVAEGDGDRSRLVRAVRRRWDFEA